MPEQKTYSVLVTDLFHYMDKEGATLVDGFSTWEDARAYARARTWSSVQELRTQGMGLDELKQRFLIFGETAMVIGGQNYSAWDDIDYFIANEPRPEEADWSAIGRRARGA